MHGSQLKKFPFPWLNNRRRTEKRWRCLKKQNEKKLPCWLRASTPFVGDGRRLKVAKEPERASFSFEQRAIYLNSTLCSMFPCCCCIPYFMMMYMQKLFSFFFLFLFRSPRSSSSPSSAAAASRVLEINFQRNGQSVVSRRRRKVSPWGPSSLHLTPCLVGPYYIQKKGSNLTYKSTDCCT